jgi:hypothetical protein
MSFKMSLRLTKAVAIRVVILVTIVIGAGATAPHFM